MNHSQQTPNDCRRAYIDGPFFRRGDRAYWHGVRVLVNESRWDDRHEEWQYLVRADLSTRRTSAKIAVWVSERTLS